MTEKNNKPIAFFDSGVGGISVLNEAIKMMPNENYIYFGDSKNAPYGIKSTSDVKKLTEKNIGFLIEKGVKAVVIACNTATSASAEYLRGKYKEIPIIGVEPALKPAALSHPGEKVLVMATPMTLAEKKFKTLMREYSDTADIIPVPCGGLMEFVEAGILDGEEIEEFLNEVLTQEIKEGSTAIVLGCTHYPFIKESISKVMDHHVQIYDGGLGTATQLKRRLMRCGLLSASNKRGSIDVINSLDDEKILKLSEKLIYREDL